MSEKLNFQFNFPILYKTEVMENPIKWNSKVPIGMAIVDGGDVPYQVFIAQSEWCKKSEGIRWRDSAGVIEETGGLFFFCEPGKIVDVCIVHARKDENLFISPPLATILWKDWKWYMPGGWKKKKPNVPFLAGDMQANIINYFSSFCDSRQK